MDQFADRFPALANALGPQNLAVLTRAMTTLELPAGRRVIRDRMPVDSLYFILEGEVSILVEESGGSISRLTNSIAALKLAPDSSAPTITSSASGNVFSKACTRRRCLKERIGRTER